ncbi:choice-of-anchor Q domain-containing protein [Wenzhouxiangella sp. EGI_FJ10409]|uniref:choice-of-anchor Q domain-containing protein n=1 Tax=Wenzhouxiangella sp. EGI_FJ10409 TaxID=3243767 RepID=UPI0035DC8DF1
MHPSTIDPYQAASSNNFARMIRSWMLALTIFGLLVSPPLAADILRLSLEGQLNDDGLSVNADYDNATFSGFFEIDLSNPLSNPASIRFYEMTSWAIDLVPEPPNPNNAPVIRFSSNNEPDDKAEVFLDRFNNTINISIEEDNSPFSRRRLSPTFDPDFNISPGTRFEDLLTADNASFQTVPSFLNGSLQFAVSQGPTSLATASLGLALRYVDGVSGDDEGGVNDCSTPASPCATIQHAIDSAQPWDGVIVADAVYTETLVVDKALDIRGASRHGTIIQAAASQGQAGDRVISVNDNTYFELSDLTIRHGNSDARGGGLRSVGDDLLIEGVTFFRNDAEGAGGGLSSGDNTVVMDNVIFRENESDREGGGASLGVNFDPTSVTLTQVSFENNASVIAGGGLDLFNSQATLADIALIGNSSEKGGGLSYRATNSVDSSLQMTSVAFRGNSATLDGGGMYTEQDTPFEMINGLFSGNLANLGGGLFNQGGTDGNRVLTNVAMTGNDAQLRGGAIDRPLQMTFRNTAIWNNRDSSGTGTAEATMDDYSASNIVEVSNSLLQGYPAGEFPGSGTLDGTDPNNNPKFLTPVSPIAAPSPAGNLRLRDTSPVIDMGENAFVSGISTDLDGFSRINDGIVDLGPYETGNDKLFQDRFEQQ